MEKFLPPFIFNMLIKHMILSRDFSYSAFYFLIKLSFRVSAFSPLYFKALRELNHGLACGILKAL